MLRSLVGSEMCIRDRNYYGGGHDGGYPNNQKASSNAGGYNYDYRSGGGGDGNGSQDSYYDYQSGGVEEPKPEVEGNLYIILR